MALSSLVIFRRFPEALFSPSGIAGWPMISAKSSGAAVAIVASNKGLDC
jgi:hypothetical protein